MGRGWWGAPAEEDSHPARPQELQQSSGGKSGSKDVEEQQGGGQGAFFVSFACSVFPYHIAAFSASEWHDVVSRHISMEACTEAVASFDMQLSVIALIAFGVANRVLYKVRT